MTKLSSGNTAFYKVWYPASWLGFLALFVVIVLISGIAREQPMFLIIPIVMSVIGLFMMRKSMWDLVDEVYDYGDGLLVKNRGGEELIPLSHIVHVDTSAPGRLFRITLRLAAPTKLGSEIAFVPVSDASFVFNPFAKHPIAEDLIIRVDQARSRRAV